MHVSWRTLAPLVVGASLYLAASSGTPVLAQTSDNTLSPEAEQAMQRGLAAAELQEWELSIRHFLKALDLAPRVLDFGGIKNSWESMRYISPEILFNLALAHDNAGGRELLAIAWFRAFLATAPDTANAKRVLQRILELEVKVEANAAKLIAKAKEVAGQLPDISTNQKTDPGASPTASRYIYLGYRYIAIAQAKTGDIAGAFATVERMTETFVPYIRPRGYIDQPGEATGELQPDLFNRDWAYVAIGQELHRAGDVDGAKAMFNRISNLHRRSDVYEELSNPMFEAVQDIFYQVDNLYPGDVALRNRTLEIYVWMIMVQEYLDRPVFKDIQGVIRSLTGKEPMETVKSLAAAASELGEALKNLQHVNVAWQAACRVRKCYAVP